MSGSNLICYSDQDQNQDQDLDLDPEVSKYLNIFYIKGSVREKLKGVLADLYSISNFTSVEVIWRK